MGLRGWAPGENAAAVHYCHPGPRLQAVFSAQIRWNDDAALQQVGYTPFLTAPNTTAPPAPPTNLAAQTGATSIAFSWDANAESDITGYKLHYDTDAAGYPYANSVDVSNVTSYTLASLTQGSTYIRARLVRETHPESPQVALKVLLVEGEWAEEVRVYGKADQSDSIVFSLGHEISDDTLHHI